MQFHRALTPKKRAEPARGLSKWPTVYRSLLGAHLDLAEVTDDDRDTTLVRPGIKSFGGGPRVLTGS